MTDQIPDIVPGDHWGFSGDLIWKAVPEVGILTQVLGQVPIIPNYPRMGVVGVTIDGCIILTTTNHSSIALV